MPENNLDFFVNFEPGADLGFSRGGGGADFQKNVQKFCRPFFRSTKLIFRAIPKQ